MTRVLLIKAGPTPWDDEGRFSGNLPLPLTDAARTNIAMMLETLPPIDAVYRCKHNEASEQVAKMIATLRKLRPRDNADLDAWCLGLWQGLRMEDLRQRYPSALQQWEEAPATIRPPEGEAFIDAIERLRGAVKKILRRNRGRTIAIVLRQSAFQIVAGILRGETPEQIATHLQNDSPLETIDVDD